MNSEKEENSSSAAHHPVETLVAKFAVLLVTKRRDRPRLAASTAVEQV